MATPSDKVHEHAVQAHSHTEQLATELAKSGADESILAPVKQCASILKKIVQASGKSGADAPAEPEEPRPTIGSATDEMVAEQKEARTTQ